MLEGAGWKHCKRHLGSLLLLPSRVPPGHKAKLQLCGSLLGVAVSSSQLIPLHWVLPSAHTYRQGHPVGSSSAGQRQHQGAAGEGQGWNFQQTQVAPRASFQIKVHSLTGKQPSQRQQRAASSAKHSFILSADLVPANLTIRLSMPQLSMPSDRNLWVRLYPEASGAGAPRWHGNNPRRAWAVSVCLGGVVMARAIPSLGKSQHQLPSSIWVTFCPSSLQEFLGLLGQSCQEIPSVPELPTQESPSSILATGDYCSNNWKSHWHFCRQGGDMSRFVFVLLTQQEITAISM